MTDFSKDRRGSGTREWSEHSFNFGRGCSHGCLYGYCRHAVPFTKTPTPAEFKVEHINEKAVAKGWGKRSGVIMTPTLHDITPYYLPAAIFVLHKMLAANNQVLIVSKPHLSCIEKLTETFAPYKGQILFRFTIGSLNSATCAFWEPGAPSPQERIKCLELAFNRGFQTSVSMEPMLGGVEMALATFLLVKPFVTDRIWIGKMRKIRQRVDMSDLGVADEVARIEVLQRDKEILRLYEKLKDDPKVAWKDSIKEVVARHGR